MDPLSQGLVGATAAQIKAPKSQMVLATIFGFLAGLSADLDVLMQSKTDPLFAVEYHRHFTHALIFIPVGASICAVCFYYLFRARRAGFSFKSVYIYCFLGYATHALLDSCTSYGTQLFWPFSNHRVAWNSVSIIDPLFTLPLLVSVIVSLISKRASIAKVAGLYALAYLGLGVVQHNRAQSYALHLAESRGHAVSRINVQPTLGNLVVWKSIYEYQERFYIDGIRVGFDSSYYQGTGIAKFNAGRDVPWLDHSATQYQDIARFEHFASGFIAMHPNINNVIADLRYSMMPQDILPLWGITLDPQRANHAHVDFVDLERDSRRAKTATTELWRMITAVEPGQRIIEDN